MSVDISFRVQCLVVFPAEERVFFPNQESKRVAHFFIDAG